MAGRNTIETRLDLAQLGLVQDALLQRGKYRRRKHKQDQERITVESLRPALKKAVIDLLNASIKVQAERGDILMSTSNHNYGYELRLEGEKEPVEISLYASSTRGGTRLLDIEDVYSFVVYPPGSNEHLSTRFNDEPELIHEYKRDRSDRAVTRPAKGKHIIAYTQLLQGLTQGLGTGAVTLKGR